MARIPRGTGVNVQVDDRLKVAKQFELPIKDDFIGDETGSIALKSNNKVHYKGADCHDGTEFESIELATAQDLLDERTARLQANALQQSNTDKIALQVSPVVSGINGQSYVEIPQLIGRFPKVIFKNGISYTVAIAAEEIGKKVKFNPINGRITFANILSNADRIVSIYTSAQSTITAGGNFGYIGNALPTDNPGVVLSNSFWTVSVAGVYIHFGSVELPEDSIGFISFDGAVFSITVVDVVYKIAQWISQSYSAGRQAYHNGNIWEAVIETTDEPGQVAETIWKKLISLENYNTLIQASEFKLTSVQTAPATSTSPGDLGEIRFTAGGLFFCVAPNLWMKFTGTTNWEE